MTPSEELVELEDRKVRDITDAVEALGSVIDSLHKMLECL